MRLLTEEEKKLYPFAAKDALISKNLLVHEDQTRYEADMLLNKVDIEIHLRHTHTGECYTIKVSYATEDFALEVFNTIKTIGFVSLRFLRNALGFSIKYRIP